MRRIELDGDGRLTDQLLFLEEEEFLQQQFLLDDLAVLTWVEVVNIVAEDWLVGWKCWDDDQGTDDDQESLFSKIIHMSHSNISQLTE